MAGLIDIKLRTGRGGFSLEVSLSLAPRCIHIIHGPSGSGKTTLLRAVAGLDASARGVVRIGPEAWLDTARGVCVPVHRRRVGFVFQEGRLFDHVDVAGNLRYGWRRTPKGERCLPFDEVMDVTGLGGLLERRPAELSAGQRQRVAFARAVLASPRVLLMDEAFSALDESAKPSLLDMVKRLARRGMTVFYVSHNSEELGALGGRTVSIRDGRATTYYSRGRISGNSGAGAHVSASSRA